MRGSVRFSCVAESTPSWVALVENVAVSLRNFGGDLAGSPLRACFVGPMSSPLLTALGVEQVRVEPFPGMSPPTNKLRMFEAFVADPDADTLIAVDCDVVVVGDLSSALTPGQVGMTPAVRSPLSPAEWHELLERLDLPAGDRTSQMQRDGQVVPAPYYNSGVMTVPAALCGPLLAAWRTYVGTLESWAAGTGSAGAVDWPADWVWHVDQLALTAALLATDTDVATLRPTCNLETGLRWRSFDFGGEPARILHHHNRLTDRGLLKATDSPALNEVVTDVNRVLTARAGRGRRDLLERLGRRR